jgi:glycosyltransferase involved in cell wall biosynthesis
MRLLALEQARQGLDVHVCSLDGGDPSAAGLAAPGISVDGLGRRWPLDPQAFWQLWGHVQRLRPDLIHTWTRAAQAYGHAAARACHVRCVISTRRGAEPAADGLTQTIDRYTAGRSDLLATDTAAACNRYAEMGLPPAKVRVVPGGVEPAPLPTSSRPQLLAELGLPEKSRLVLMAGPLLARKRIKDAIWAADLLKVIRDDVYLLVLGSGAELDRLLRFRDQVVIRDKVRFLGERGDVARFLPHGDVFWSTSAVEGQSIAILEAMAAALPVVATDIAGTRDLVVDGVTGHLVVPGHRAGFARWTNQLLDDALLAARLGAAGRQRARTQFSAENMLSRYGELYRELSA